MGWALSSHRICKPTPAHSALSLRRIIDFFNFTPSRLQLPPMLQSATRLIFGPTPTEKVKKWQTQLKKESRVLAREIAALERETAKVKGEVKKLATKGEMKNAKLLAREVVRSNKQRERLFTSQARLNSINMQLTHQLGIPLPSQRACSSLTMTSGYTATLKITGTLQKSTEIMKLSNSLIKLPELSQTMREISQEMMKVRPFFLSIVPPPFLPLQHISRLNWASYRTN